MSSPTQTNLDAAAEGDSAEGELVTISRWELDALRFRAAGAQTADFPPVDEVQPVADPVPPPAQESRDPRIAELERAYKGAIRDRELATALAGRPLVPGAAAQLIKLWRDDFDAYEEAGEVKVVARDGRTVAKAVAERLAEGEYAHFCPSTTRGGASARGMGRTPGAGASSSPRTLGEAAIQRWREAGASRPDPASGPIGLRRR